MLTLPTQYAPTELQAMAFKHFALQECPQDPVYAAICMIMAESPELLTLMAHAPATQRRPNLLLAALHDLLLAHPGHALADYFPSVGGHRAVDAALRRHFIQFVQDHQALLVDALAHRHTQTNEIGRCAVLWPALQKVRQLCNDQPMALLDLGCSAGLNLGVDRYHYDYGAFQGGAAVADGISSVQCEWHGDPPPEFGPLRLHSRLGLDLKPVDIHNPAEVRWLQACVWPCDLPRMQRLRRAIDQARKARDPVCRGGSLADIEGWLNGVPPGVVPVLFNSWVLSYFAPQDLKLFRLALDRWTAQKGLVWLSAEAPELRPPHLSCPLWPSPRLATGKTLWTVQWPEQGGIRQQALAWSHPHGQWLHWLHWQEPAVRPWKQGKEGNLG